MKRERANSNNGTPSYRAPEMWDAKTSNGYTMAVDWFALGVTLYEMMVGLNPFDTKGTNDLRVVYKNIKDNNILFPENFDKAARSLIQRLTRPDASIRYGMDPEIMKNKFKIHKFFENTDWDELINFQSEVPDLLKNLYETKDNNSARIYSCNQLSEKDAYDKIDK